MREATTGGTAAARQVSVDDAALLRKLGYQQELKRGLRPFENVAMGFAAISPVVAYITGGTFESMAAKRSTGIRSGTALTTANLVRTSGPSHEQLIPERSNASSRVEMRIPPHFEGAADHRGLSQR